MDKKPSKVHAFSKYRWKDIPQLIYKEEGSAPFSKITRQVLFHGQPELNTQLRYFEIEPDGYSTLEKHEHLHVVLILRGRGQMLLGDAIHDVREHDIIHIQSYVWHQFRANQGQHLGFLCMVNCERDKPHLPTPEDLLELKENPNISSFIQLNPSFEDFAEDGISSSFSDE